jgi:hypothetical protein
MAKNPKRIAGTTAGRQTAALEEGHRAVNRHDPNAINMRDLVLGDLRSAVRLAQFSGFTASELKAEIDRDYKAGWA